MPVLVAVIFAFIQFTGVAHADVVDIGQVTPSGPSPNDYIEGIAFDGTSNPLILDAFSWTMSRVSLANAAVLSSAASSPIPTQRGTALTYDPATSSFFAMGDNTYLNQIQSGTLNVSQVGSGVGEFFNFNALAEDPQGNLWLVTDNNGNSLWEINKQTGVGTLKTQISLPVNNQAIALAITGSGQFIIYSTAPVTNGVSTPEYFYQLNPNSGNATQFSEAFINTPTNFADITAMAYDPVNKDIYGIQENVLASPRTYDLVQITGVPEPGSLLLLGGIATIGLMRRKRRPAEMGEKQGRIWD